MAYRDETEHLRARVAELEDELAGAQQRIHELEDPGSVTEKSLGEKLAGAKLRVVRELVLPGELPAEAHEEIVEILRRRYNVLGQASSVGKSLGWSNAVPQSTRAVEISITARNGKTTIRGVERLGNLAGGLYGGIVGGVGGGGLGLVVPLAITTKSPELIPFAMVAWLTMVYGIVRFAFSRVAAGRERELRAAVDEIATAARASIGAAKKVRVDQEQTEAEADAEEEPEEEPAPERKRARRKRPDD